MPHARPTLRALADRLGIEPGYVSALDQRRVETSDATRERLCWAMGHDASSERSAERSLADLEPERPTRQSESPPCASIAEHLKGSRGFGIWANLYSVRSPRGAGFGSLGDLGQLVRLAAREGASFVGVNPLHALTHRSDGACPYSPISRLFRSPLYLDLAPLEQSATSPGARAAFAAQAPALAELRGRAALALTDIERALYAVLRPLHAERSADPTDAEARAVSGGSARPDLAEFATFQALADANEPSCKSRDWRDWPAPLRDSTSTAVRAFRESHASAVDFHAWLQLTLEAQLSEVARIARSEGMPIGLYTDLALGSAPGGFDTWRQPSLFARGVSMGAPPDSFAQSGQVWGVPPLDPHALRRSQLAFWRELLEANLHAAGAIRIDHALGLRRLFWIPDGRPASEGAYVRSPERELLDVLCQVSRERDTPVIAEDLGTIPEGFSAALQQRGLLSSKVLLFERDRAGYHPSAAWPTQCLATANTHDLPPLAGWLTAEDVELRFAVGQIPDAESRERIAREREDDRRALRARLESEGHLTPGVGPEDAAEWIRATTALLCRTPALLVGLSLDDLALERTPINVPGVASTHHPSWTRRMGRDLEAIFEDSCARRCLDAVPAERRVG